MKSFTCSIGDKNIWFYIFEEIIGIPQLCEYLLMNSTPTGDCHRPRGKTIEGVLVQKQVTLSFKENKGKIEL